MSWLRILKDYQIQTPVYSALTVISPKNVAILVTGDTDGGTIQLRTRAPGEPGTPLQLKWQDNNSNDWMTAYLTDIGGALAEGIYRFLPLYITQVDLTISGIGAAGDFSVYMQGVKRGTWNLV